MNYLYRTITERDYAQELRLYNIGNYLLEKYQKLWRVFFTQKKNVVKKRAMGSFIFSTLPEIISIFALMNAGKDVLEGTYSIGDFTVFSGLLTQLVSNLHILIGSFINVYENKLKIDYLSDFRKLVSEKKQNGERLLGEEVNIEFKDVSFRYPGTEKYVLKNVNFSVNQGKKICIVGGNGAGKTTIFKLLLRFYDPDEGIILINGYPLQCYDVNTLRNRFSCFFQNAANFSFSLKENIMISQVEKDKVNVEKSLKRAYKLSGTDKMIQLFPEGEDTYLSRMYEENGVELSGGQNQKVALARMFYKNASVLILDEPSASLDPKSEYELFQSLRNECSTQSIIFVSHRLSNVYLADEIIVIENGSILAKGAHEELLMHCEFYQRLYQYQADKFIKKGEYESSGNR